MIIMKHIIITLTWLGALALQAAGQTIPPNQGGSGTIDPAKVGVHEIVRSTISAASGGTQKAAAIATDSAGDHIIGSIVRSDGPSPTIRSLISKFDRSNKLVWQRERTVTSDNTGYYEQWGDGKPPQPVPDNSGFLSLEVAAIVVDNQDNVIVAFNCFQPDYNNGVQSLVRSQLTLLAKFDSAGKLVWRTSAPASFARTDMPNAYYIASEVRSFQKSSDGSFLVLIDNYQVGGQNVHQTVAWKVGSGGKQVFINHYGADSAGHYSFASTPIALAEDGSANLYLLSTEYKDTANLYKTSNVIRKLDPNGRSLAQKSVPLYPGYMAGSSLYTTETWSAARADGSGNLYIGGDRFRIRPSLHDSDQGEAKQLVLKFKPDLSQTWRSLGPQATGRFVDQPRVTVVDLQLSSGGVTVGGYWSNTGPGASENDFHWELTRYAADDGHLVWHRLYQSATSDPNQGWEDTLNAFRLDSAGNVYASGVVSYNAGVRQALIKYSDAGDLQFVKLFPNSYISLQATSLTLPPATKRPTFFGTDQFHNAQVVVIEFDNPAVVAAVGSLANISTRVRVGGNDNVLIGGFIVTGSAGTTKKVLVRAIGPSLSQNGVTDALPDTTLELHDSAGHVFTNDNWKTADPGQPNQESEIQASGVAPTSELESALIATVPPGDTTAIVRGKGGASGVGLVEVYDIDAGAAARIANISTRGSVETGNNVMIGGVIVLQPNPARVMVRAIGPSLTAAGVANALQDPQLELRDVNGTLVVSNDDWKKRDGSGVSQQSEIEATTIAPKDPRESAVRVTLDPGNYTAIVRGKGGTTGVGLVEAYNLQ